MDDRAVFGEVSHRLTFGRAIEQDLLSDYRVVVLATTDTEAADLIDTRRLVETQEMPLVDAATLATLGGVARAVDELGLRRLISFHRTIDRARSFAVLLGAAHADWAQPIDAAFVSGQMTAGDRSSRLDRLRRGDDRPALVANARCLTEGVDVPALDGVVFVDPRWSPIDIIQAVGRVMRKAENKGVGTIVVPVVVRDGADADAILDDSAFEIVWSVVRALRSHDERLAEILMDARTELGRRGRVPPWDFLRDRFTVLDIPRSIDARAFREAISLRIVDAGSLGFDEAMGRLLAFAEEHGHSRVPQGRSEPDGFRLGSWVNNRRNDHRAGRLTADQIERIEAVSGWSWEPHDDAFADGLARLRAFATEHGHALVPVSYRSPDGFKLGRWIVTKRVERRSALLDDTRARELEGLPGWSWDPQDDGFEEGLRELHQFAEQRGHTRIPMSYRTDSGFKLGTWAFVRRQDKRNGRLAPTRISALEAVQSWVWTPLDDVFEQGLRELTAFAERHGHLRVPARHREVDGLVLKNWVNNRRTDYKAGRLSAEEIAAIEAVPWWSWNAQVEGFERGIRYLRDYAAEHGTARVPLGHRTSDGFKLGSWVNNRRTEFRAGKLTAERADMLEAIEGWRWGTSRARPQD